MFELVKLTDNDYYIKCPTQIGIVKLSDSEVCLIDSGIDSVVGRKIRQILDANSWHLKTIYNTHAHADHIGGNAYLQKKTGCEIYAPKAEAALANNIFLEGSLLYAGNPVKELQKKFFMAEQSDVKQLTEQSLPKGFSIIPLPGHCFQMVGFRTPDNTIFIGDAVSSESSFSKFLCNYTYDIGSQLETLGMLKELKAKMFVPSHADTTNNLNKLIEYNEVKINQLADVILSLCRNGICFDELMQQLFETLNFKLTIEQYYLVGSTIQSYLSWLRGLGRIEAVIENNMLTWKSINN